MNDPYVIGFAAGAGIVGAVTIKLGELFLTRRNGGGKDETQLAVSAALLKVTENGFKGLQDALGDIRDEHRRLADAALLLAERMGPTMRERPARE